MTDSRHAPIRLADELPELVAYIRAGLEQQGRQDLIGYIEAARVFDAGSGTSSGDIDLVPNLDSSAMIAHPDRERIWIGSPRGVARRQWAIAIEVIHGRVWSIAIARPGILREPLRRLGKRVRAGASHVSLPDAD